jgi:hypothetical protein
MALPLTGQMTVFFLSFPLGCLRNWQGLDERAFHASSMFATSKFWPLTILALPFENGSSGSLLGRQRASVRGVELASVRFWRLRSPSSTLVTFR